MRRRKKKKKKKNPKKHNKPCTSAKFYEISSYDNLCLQADFPIIFFAVNNNKKHNQTGNFRQHFKQTPTHTHKKTVFLQPDQMPPSNLWFQNTLLSLSFAVGHSIRSKAWKVANPPHLQWCHPLVLAHPRSSASFDGGCRAGCWRTGGSGGGCGGDSSTRPAPAAGSTPWFPQPPDQLACSSSSLCPSLRFLLSPKVKPDMVRNNDNVANGWGKHTSRVHRTYCEVLNIVINIFYPIFKALIHCYLSYYS